jgi:hypothetical protein
MAESVAEGDAVSDAESNDVMCPKGRDRCGRSALPGLACDAGPRLPTWREDAEAI